MTFVPIVFDWNTSSQRLKLWSTEIVQFSFIYNPWHWLTSQSAAEAMAEKVSTWFDKYNVDGIDLDIEEGAGAKPESGTNMIHFVRKLRQLRPDIIIGQPTYGFPAVS